MTTDTSVPDLTQALALKIDLLSNTDPAWVTFVNDHISYIRQNSRIVTIDDAARDRYRFKFEHFLRDNICSANVFWIATLINDLTQYENFVLREQILIPNVAYIKVLYRKYQTSRNEG